MPFYEYRCQACGEHVEALQSISEPPLVDCPACNKPELKKQISAAGFRLKGGGWYETDFKSSNKRQLHDSGDSEKKSDKSDKTDSKTTAKSESKSTDKAKAAPKAANNSKE